MRNNRIPTPQGGGSPHRLGAERHQRLREEGEQLVDGLGAGPRQDVGAHVAGTCTVTLGTTASVKSLTSGRPRAGEAA